MQFVYSFLKTVSPILISLYSATSLPVLTLNVFPANDFIIYAESLLFFHSIFTSKPPLARNPLTEPFFYAFGYGHIKLYKLGI